MSIRPATAALLLVSSLLFFAGLFAGRQVSGGPAPAAVAPVPEVREVAPAEPAPLPPIAESLLAIAPGPPLTGDRIIHGTVTTADGQPLAGVTVRAVPRAPWRYRDRGAPPPAGDPNQESVEVEVRHILSERSGIRETVSDQSGAFLISGFSGSVKSVHGYKRGFDIREEERDEDRAGDEVRLIAHPVVELEVRVLGPDGKPPERATLRIQCTGRFVSTHRDWRPGRHRIDLNPGPIRIRASAGTRSGIESAEVERWLKVGIRPEPVILQLREQTGIRGKLTFPPAADRFYSSYRILALRVREGAVVDPSRLLREFHHEGRLHSYSPRNGHGDFVMTDLPPGTYLVGVASGYDAIHDSTIVRLAEGMETVELAVPLPDAGETTTVRVFGPDGRPVREEDSVEVSARYVTAGGGIVSGSRPSPLGKGAWRVPVPEAPPDDEGGGRFVLLLDSRTFGRTAVEYEPGVSGEVKVRFAAPATLTVTIPDYPGSDYEGKSRIRLDSTLARELQNYPAMEERPDPHGRVTFGPVAPGEWVVRLTVSSGPYGTATILSVPVHLASGTDEIVLSPPALFELTVQTGQPGGTARLEPQGAKSWGQAQADSSGIVRFTLLTAGQYILWRFGPDMTEGMRIALANDTVLKFHPEAFDALVVSIVDPKGILGAAGLRDGDLVIAVAGTRPENADHGRALLGRYATGGPVDLTVRRGSEQLTIPVDLEWLWDGKRAGGSIRPWPGSGR